MDTSDSRRFPWLLLAGVVVVIAMCACGAAFTLGAGSFLWITGRSSEPSGVEAPMVNVETPASEAETQAASLQTNGGLVEAREAAGEWMVVQDGIPLSTGQSLRTGPLSSATLTFPDGSQARLGALTEIAINNLDFGDGRQVVLSQVSGESTHTVAPSKSSKSLYRLETPSGVAEALGTRFSVSVEPEVEARFYVEDGSLHVTSGGETVVLEAGQTTSVTIGETPASPSNRVVVEGAVQQTGEAWMIAGQPFTVNQGTAISGNPQSGDIVRVEGYSSVDGATLAEAITLLRASPQNRFTLVGDVRVIDEAAWEIAGQTVTISATTWIEPGIDIGDSVRAEGVIRADGGLLADHILLFSEEDGYPFDITGVVQSIENGIWRVSGLSISVDGDTSIAPDLGVGDVVQVSGRVLPDGTWLARRILPAAPQFHTFELIGRLESLDPWRVAGITLQTREWTEIQAGLVAGDLVQVRGFIQEDGAWVAYQILRVEESPNPLIVIIGRVISVDPWVVSGIPLDVTTETIIEGEITPGMLVRVEAYLLPDGSWQVVRISALDVFIGIPGCMVLNATVVGVEGDILRLLGWPKLEMDEDIRVEGDLRPNSIVLVQLCFDEDGRLIIVLISLAYDPDDEDGDEPPEMGDKVTLCHKPYKKQGGHSITVSRSALPAHLGHGDYIGGCSR